MINKIFLIFFFSILLTFPVFVNAQEDCIFDKHISVNGSSICYKNCKVPLIRIRELSDFCINPKNDVGVSFLPYAGSDWEPPPKSPRKNKFEPFCINPPLNPNFYDGVTDYYYLVAGSQIDKILKIEVINSDNSEKDCKQNNKNKNSPPKWVCEGEYPIKERETINLSECFIDEDNDTLKFDYTKPDNFQILKENEFIEIIPDDSFSGNRTIILTASDGKSKSFDKKIKLIVSKESEPQPPKIPDKWDTLVSFLSKNRRWILLLFLIIAGIFYARFKWKTPVKDSIKGVRKKAVETFEKTIKKFGIPKTKK